MKELLTPKQVARAIDVSESSIKRWCDKGVLAARYTAGGHRRIALSDLVEFLRQSDYELVQPQALGLPPSSGPSVRAVERARDQLTEALVRGDEDRCRQLLVDLYLAEHSISAICDDVVAAAFREIGDRWACGTAEVYQERRGCEIALRVLHDLRSLLPAPPHDGPIAIGCTPAGDQYSLGTSMVELVLRDSKWQATSLGSNLPLETLAAAIRTNRPDLVWLSCSHLEDVEQFTRDYGELYDEFAMDVAIVVGGFALTERVRQRMKYTAYCDTLQHLESFSQTLRNIRGKAQSTTPRQSSPDAAPE